MGQFREELLNRLESLLGDVSEKLAAMPSGQVSCGTCTMCCHASVITSHNVSELEFALVAKRVGEVASETFRQFVSRERGPDGALVHSRCPHLKDEAGCQIYQVRPYSCRLFGHVRHREAGLPKDCFFEGHETVIEESEYYRRAPGASELRNLWREFQLLMPVGAARDSRPNPDDPLDRALQLVGAAEFTQALQELASAPPSPARLELEAMSQAGLGHHRLALEAYRAMWKSVPPRADSLFQAGCSSFMEGDLGTSERMWKESIRLSPDYAPALGMLGYLAQLSGRLAEAAAYLQRAVVAAPDNDVYAARLRSLVRP